MVHVEWIVSTTLGPAVGSTDVADPSAAWNVVRDALQAALGKNWGPDHAAAVARLERASQAPLAVDGRWSHVSTAFVIRLTLAG